MTFLADAYTPPPPETGDLDFSLQSSPDSPLVHLHDPTGKERRLIEGWASLAGLDWQDMEIVPAAFEDAAGEYLRKNPTLLWDHKRYLPIGQVHSLTVDKVTGLYLRGEIYRAEDYGKRVVIPEEDAEKFPGLESIAAKADEVWGMVKRGWVLGLSIGGKARLKRQVYSEDLDRLVTQVLKVLLYEISVTPTQVHPGARIQGANLLAKALETEKPKASKRCTFAPRRCVLDLSRLS